MINITRILSVAAFSALLSACNKEDAVVSTQADPPQTEKPSYSAWTSASASYLPLIPVLYQNGYYGGEERIILENISHFDNVAFNNHASSIIVHKGPNYQHWKDTHEGREPVVTVYKDGSYTGTAMRLKIGRYSNLHDADYGFGDAISSFKYVTDETFTHAPTDTDNLKNFTNIPIVVELYNNLSYNNHFHTIIYSTDNLSTKIGSSHNDEATSLYVKRGPNWTYNSQVEFCKGTNYTTCSLITANSGDTGYTDLRPIGYDNTITSVKIKDGSATVVNYP